MRGEGLIGVVAALPEEIRPLQQRLQRTGRIRLGKGKGLIVLADGKPIAKSDKLERIKGKLPATRQGAQASVGEAPDIFRVAEN